MKLKCQCKIYFKFKLKKNIGWKKSVGKVMEIKNNLYRFVMKHLTPGKIPRK